MIQEKVLLDAGVPQEQVQRLKAAWDAFTQVKTRPRREIPCVVCAGIYNAGKSTLLNALTEHTDEYFPTGDVPTTRKMKQLEYQGAAYIDTPGLNADVEDDAETRKAYETADYILFVTNTQDGGISAKEAEWLCRMRDRYTQEGFRQRLIYVLSQSDQVADEDLPGIRDRAVQDFEKALGFAPDMVFTVDSVSWQEGQRDGNHSAREESGIPALREYLLTKTAEAKETIARAEQAELDSRRQEVNTLVFDIVKVCKTSQAEAARNTQAKLAEVDKAWSAFEAELEKALPESSISPISETSIYQSNYVDYSDLHSSSKSGFFGGGKSVDNVKNVLRRYYEEYNSIVREKGEEAVSRISRYLSSGTNSVYFNTCDQINKIFSNVLLTLTKYGIHTTAESQSEIKVDVEIPSSLEDTLVDTFVWAIYMKKSFSDYAESIREYYWDSGKMCDADGNKAAERITKHIEYDIRAGARKANNEFHTRVWRSFNRELRSQVDARKSALKQQVDAYRNQLRNSTGDGKIASALSHLETLAKEARS